MMDSATLSEDSLALSGIFFVMTPVDPLAVRSRRTGAIDFS